jgi:uncharacterized membrane protein YdbT with pleckstrin-like domain
MGNYINNHLIRDESVVYETKFHWVIFLSLRGLFSLFLIPLFERMNSEFAVTNRRIIIKTGFVGRRTIEMNLSKIESVNVDQTVIGRIFGFGDITIIGTGGTRETFSHIQKPLELRKAFQEMC